MTKASQNPESPQARTADEKPAIIVCPNCEKTYRSPGIDDGTPVRCAACKHTFRATIVEPGKKAESTDSDRSEVSQFRESKDEQNAVEFADAESEKKYFTIRIPRLLVLCIVAVFLFQMIYVASFIVVDFIKHPPQTDNAVAKDSQEVDSESNQEPQNEPKAVTAEFEIEIERKSPSRTNQSNPFLTELNRAVERQRQQRQQWRQFSDQLYRCKSCGGQGSYSYVDNLGNLRTRTCPNCNGLGNNKLIDERMRY